MNKIALIPLLIGVSMAYADYNPFEGISTCKMVFNGEYPECKYRYEEVSTWQYPTLTAHIEQYNYLKQLLPLSSFVMR